MYILCCFTSQTWKKVFTSSAMINWLDFGHLWVSVIVGWRRKTFFSFVKLISENRQDLGVLRRIMINLKFQWALKVETKFFVPGEWCNIDVFKIFQIFQIFQIIKNSFHLSYRIFYVVMGWSCMLRKMVGVLSLWKLQMMERDAISARVEKNF